MKKNYSDGLEFLIKKHVCVLTEMALQQPMEGHYQAIHEKFAKLVRKSEELGISYYYEDEKLRSEQEALSRAVSGLISYLRQHAGEQKPYQIYLWSLDIFLPVFTALILLNEVKFILSGSSASETM